VKKKIFPGEAVAQTDKQRRASFKGIFVTLPDGFLCSECIPLETEISSSSVETWRECSHGWTGPVICNECQLSIPVYVDAREDEGPPGTPPKDSKGNVVRASFKDEALVAYRRANELDEDPMTYDEAERLYREAIRLDPTFHDAWTNLGNVRHRRRDSIEAVECYKRAIEIDPSHVEGYYNIGCVYSETGSPSRSIAFYDKALSVVEKDDPILADVHYRLAMALDEIGSVEKARVHWQVYIDLKPDGEWVDAAREWLKSTEPRPRPKLIAIRGGRS
jgi:hypothetical protein